MSEVAVLAQEMTSAEEAPSSLIPSLISSINPPYNPLWTTQDVEQLPNIDGIRIEILHGELILSKSPSWEHQRTCNKVAYELTRWSTESGLGEVAPTPGVLLSKYENVIPDIVWASKELLQTSLDPAGHLTRSPELVIEVLSFGKSNVQRSSDRVRETKLEIYDEFGSLEYWIVDWRAKQIYVHRRVDGKLRLVESRLQEELVTSPILPGFSVPASRFFN